jgi:N-succinyldiaminopimelate aminotransferase
MQFTGNRRHRRADPRRGPRIMPPLPADKSSVNPDLARLQPYPFEKLRQLFAGVAPAPTFREIKLSIGEPQHETPPFIQRRWPTTSPGWPTIRPPRARMPCARRSPPGSPAATACRRRMHATQVVPVNGSREALFAFAQAVIDRSRGGAKVVCPNPFYQIYEGAALLAGAQPVFLNTCRTRLRHGLGGAARAPGATCNWCMSARRATRPAR